MKRSISIKDKKIAVLELENKILQQRKDIYEIALLKVIASRIDKPTKGWEIGDKIWETIKNAFK